MSLDDITNTSFIGQLASARRSSRIAILLDFVLSLVGAYLVIGKPLPDLLPAPNQLGGFSGLIGFSLVFSGLTLAIIYAERLDAVKKSMHRESRKRELSKEKVVYTDLSNQEAQHLLEELRKSEEQDEKSA